LGGNQNNFHGKSVENTAALIQLTYAGDINFDGKVDASDQSSVNYYIHHQPSQIDWAHGDLDYDGLVNSSDLDIVNQAIHYQTDHHVTFSRLDTGIVPEPSTFALLGIGGLGLLVYFRRQKSK
jgi:hypothetical protein